MERIIGIYFLKYISVERKADMKMIKQEVSS